MSRADAGNPGDQGIASQLKDKAAELKDKAAEMASNARDVGAQVRDAATEHYQAARDAASEYYQAGKDKAAQWEEGIEEYVRQQPVKALVIAAGVGVLLGIIWKRL